MRLMYQRLCLRVLGVLSLLLPIVLTAGTAAFDGCSIVLASLSHYYYTTMSPVFVGLLYATGLFLFFYKGNTRAEQIATRFAGICIVFVAVLPTSKDIYGCCVRPYSPSPVGEEFHKAFAAFFLLTMSVLFCLFARSNGKTTKQARLQNRLYYVSAATITTIVFTVVALSKPGWLALNTQAQLLQWMTAYKPIFWLEWLALGAVGASWLTKGQWLLAELPLTDSAYQSQAVYAETELTVC